MSAMGPPAAPSFRQALRYWLWLGCISFGGPAGQIAIMHTDLVEKRRWVSEGRFMHALNYCMILPGPEAQQLATYLGFLLHGLRGALAAGLLFILPSLLLLMGLSWAYLAAGPSLSGQLLYGVKPAVVAIVLFAGWRIGRKALLRPLAWLIAAGSLMAASLQVPYPAVIAASAAIGWLFRRYLVSAPHASSVRSSAGSAQASVIDDHSPTPSHVQFGLARALGVLSVGALLVGLAMALVLLTPLADTVLPDMALFFGKAALITFGGAYAVLPYVFSNAVNHYAWITAPQMLDGLALGETTPGPLIMVVAFIGSVGAASHAGVLPSWQMGVLGALVATFFTFLPSFLFILLGAPWVERSRGSLRLAGPLTAVTAAVVGAILLLALKLAAEVVLPLGQPDWFALAVATAGFVSLWRGWLGIVGLIGISMAFGLAAQALT